MTTLVLLAVVWNSTSISSNKNLTSRLKLAETVVLREVDRRERALIRNSRLLVDDFMFKRALKSGVAQDIKLAIESYQELINAAFISVRDDKGAEIESSGRFLDSLNNEITRASKSLTNNSRDTSEVLLADGRLLWLLYVPISNVEGGKSLSAVFGFIIGESYLQSLKKIAGLDVSLLIEGEPSVVISSLTKSKQQLSYIEESLVDSNSKSWLYFNPLFNSNTLFSRKFVTPAANSFHHTVYISADASEVKSQFLQLQITIGLIALIALLVAIIAGKILSKQITRPLEYIAKYAVNISKGDYKESIKLNASSLELDQLLSAFKSMEVGVKQRESKIKFQAQHDMLTKLYNRSYFTEYLNTLFANKTCFQVIGINISGFRTINDVFGYQYGDACVKELAIRVQQHGGTSARITGGEILWIPTTNMQLEEILEFKSSLDKRIQIEKISLQITTSIGIINCPSDTNTAEDLYRRMNIVIDEAQLKNSLIAEFSHDFEDVYLRRLTIIENLKSALTNDSSDLSLAYQPQIGLEQHSVKHAEALIRWNDKELGFVPPDEFILIAEQAGLIHQVTAWVIAKVCTDIQYFKQQGIDICVAVNISAQDLLDDEFTNRTRALLSKYNLNNSDISFELTESVIVQDPEKSIQQMQILRDEGFSLAIDDFGTGYSSLSYITRLPVDTIKIDKCFVIPLASNEGEQSICKAVLKLASNFNMHVVAEGVEDKKSVALLKKWGCKYAQGYYISRPISAHELIVWISENERRKSPILEDKTV
jgi:diguanylate cyclase (GGDEF)-like protein